MLLCMIRINLTCLQEGERVVAMVNNLGSATSLEMNCMTFEALTQMKARNVSRAA